MHTARISFVGLLAVVSVAASAFETEPQATLWLPDLVSTPNAEVRLTFSPDGKRMLWGAIDWPEGRGSWDVYESRQTAAGWSKPVTVPFDSTAKEFDPSFAPDGSGVFFFSDRDGGSGKEDLYFAPFDPAKQQYQAAKNLGPVVNTPGEEWAPVLSRDGQRLLFTSDGHRGAGKHDLFIATRRGDAWVDVTNLAAVNSADDELDAAFLEDDRSIVFARGDVATTVDLYVAEFRDGKLQPAVRLSDAVNSTQAGVSTFGPAISAHDPGALYFTSRHTESRGRADIYRIGYRLGH